MQPTRYLGNCSGAIDWNSVVDGLDLNSSDTMEGGETNELNRRLHDAQTKRLQAAGYTFAVSQGVTFYYWERGGFDRSVLQQFGEWVNADMVFAWISAVRPGGCVPQHSDFDYDRYDQEITENKHRLTRWHCHISPGEFGQVFCVEDQCFYLQPIGAVYQWQGLDLIHGGGNFGLSTKYLWSALGYARDQAGPTVRSTLAQQ